MSSFHLSYDESDRCTIHHRKNRVAITTDLPPEYGGKGRSFSSTDLVSAAIGSCYLGTVTLLLHYPDAEKAETTSD